MQTTLRQAELADYLSRQLYHFFPDEVPKSAELRPFVKHGLERLEHCLARMRDKYLPGGKASFNHRHTDQYAMFLYFAGNSVHRSNGDPNIGEKLYALNKALHAIDVYYEVALPDIFFFQH